METNNKILIVDDNDDNIRLIKEILMREKLESNSAHSGTEALQSIEYEIPDLVLLDINMPGMNGLDVCLKLKTDERTCNIPVIFLTANTERTLRIKGLELGAVDYLTKPIERNELVARVKTHLKINSLQKELIKANVQLEEKVKTGIIELENTTSQLQTIFNNQHILVATMDSAFNYIKVNASFAATMGKSTDFFIGKNHFDFVNCDDGRNIFEHVLQTCQSQFRYATRLDFTARTIYNHDYWDWSLIPVENNNDEKITLIFSMLNVTDNVIKTKALINSEERYRRITESISDYVYKVYINNGIPENTVHGVACEMILGYTADQLNADPYLWYDIIYPEDNDKVVKFIYKILSEKKQDSIEHRIYHKNGQLKWIKNSIVLFFDNNENIIEYNGIITDITEKKIAEIALQKSEEKYKFLADNIPAMIVEINKDLEYLYVNRLFVETFEVTIENVIGKHIFDVLNEQSYAKIKPYVDKVLDGEIVDYEETLQHKNLDVQWYNMKYVPEFSDNGEVKGYIALIINIQQRKELELAIKASEEKFRLIADFSHDWEIYLDKNDSNIYTNKSIKNFIGYTPEAYITGKINDRIIIYKDDYTRATEKFAELNQGKAVTNFTIRYLHQNGKIVYGSVNAHPVIIGGNVVGKRLSIRDITSQFEYLKTIESRQKQLQAIFDISPVILITVDQELTIQNINTTGLHYLKDDFKVTKKLKIGDGFSCQNSFSASCTNSTECNACVIRNNVADTFQNKTEHTKVELKLFVKNDNKTEKIYFLISTRILIIEQKEHVLIMLDDISQLKQAERELKRNQKNLERAEKIAQLGYWQLDLKTYKFTGSDNLTKMYGVPLKNASAAEVSTLVLAEYNSIRDLALMELINQNIPYNIEFKIKKLSTGEIVDIRSIAEYDKAKNKVFGIVQDITETKRDQQALVESEERYKLLSDATFEGILLTRQGQIIDFNDQFIKMFGYTYDDVKNLRLKDFVLPDDLEKVFKNIETQSNSIYKHRGIKKNGQIIYLEVNARTVYKNDVTYRLTVLHDVTERKIAENQIINAIVETEEKERLRFAQDLHDGLGPIISAIKMYLDWMKKPDIKTSRDHIVDETLGLVNSAHKSLHEIAFNLSPHLLQNFGLTEALTAFIKTITEGQEMKINFKNNSTTKFDLKIETILYRFLTESINNTVKYAQASQIDITINQSGDIFEITYIDNGIGFNVEEVLQKRQGLGLFNLKNRIKSINGNLDITSNSNGTKIAVKLDKPNL